MFQKTKISSATLFFSFNFIVARLTSQASRLAETRQFRSSLMQAGFEQREDGKLFAAKKISRSGFDLYIIRPVWVFSLLSASLLSSHPRFQNCLSSPNNFPNLQICVKTPAHGTPISCSSSFLLTFVAAITTPDSSNNTSIWSCFVRIVWTGIQQ